MTNPEQPALRAATEINLHEVVGGQPCCCATCIRLTGLIMQREREAVAAATPGIIRTCARVICFGCQEGAEVAPNGCGGLIHPGGYGNCHAIALREKFPEAFEPDVRMQGRY
jgi:hypothetical protein